MKKIFLGLLVFVIISLGFLFLLFKKEVSVKNLEVGDLKNGTYSIEGENVKLINGISEKENIPNSSSKIITRYFGNEFFFDLNNDNVLDGVFMLTQEGGGSGVFYYVVALVSTKDGYLGSSSYFLGDRIAPQNIVISQNPRHKNVIVVNYADRKIDEPMSISPSIGKSVYLKIDPSTRQWGIVMPDFEGESR